MKTIRGFALALAVLMAFSCVLLAGCQNEQPQTPDQVQYEVANYQGQLAEGQTKSDYNKELFYRNDRKIGEAAGMWGPLDLMEMYIGYKDRRE